MNFAERSAPNSDPNAIEPGAAATNSGLIPYRSRAGPDARASTFHHASANMPRTRSSAAGAVEHQQPQQHLGVAGAAQSLAARLELATQLPVVVNLAVEHDQMSAVEHHRLRRACAEVDDRETPMHEQNVRSGRRPRPGSVRATVRQAPCPGHRPAPADQRSASRRVAQCLQCHTSGSRIRNQELGIEIRNEELGIQT